MRRKIWGHPYLERQRIVGELRMDCPYSKGWKQFQKWIIHSLKCHEKSKRMRIEHRKEVMYKLLSTVLAHGKNSVINRYYYD